MSPELINTIGTIAGMIVAALGAFLFAFWIAMGIWTFHDIRQRTRDWLVIILAVALVLIFPLIGLILYMMIRPKATLADVYDRALEEEALLRELEQTAACHNCGVPVKEGWVYCPNCHNQLQHSCPSCGNLVRNEWEICVFCGSGQQRSAPQIAAAPARPTALPGQTIAGQAVAGQALPMQTMPAQGLSGQGLPGQPLAGQPATTGRSFRSPFRRDAVTPPPATSGNQGSQGNPVTPPPLPPDLDDAPYRPARMPD